MVNFLYIFKLKLVQFASLYKIFHCLDQLQINFKIFYLTASHSICFLNHVQLEELTLQ